MEDNNNPTMLTIRVTAKRTNLPENMLRTLVKENKIVFICVGNRYLINLEKLIAYLNSGDTVQEEKEQLIVLKKDKRRK